MPNYDIALPVTVQVRNGAVVGAFIDYDGAPWMYADSEPNAWNVDGEQWEAPHTGDPNPTKTHDQAAAWLRGVIERSLDH